MENEQDLLNILEIVIDEEEDYDRYMFLDDYHAVYRGIDEEDGLSYEELEQYFFNHEYEVDQSIESIKERLDLLLW